MSISENLFPVCGCITALLIFLSPLQQVLQVKESQEIGVVNSFPFSMMVLNCLANLIYGIYLDDSYIFLPNWIGLSLGLYYMLTTLPLQPKKIRELGNNIVIFGITSILLIMGLCFMRFSLQAGKTILGWTTVVCLVMFYTSPLSTLARVFPLLILGYSEQKFKLNKSCFKFGKRSKWFAMVSLWYSFAKYGNFIINCSLLQFLIFWV
jgi:solute carrier family 50 protein (sugar transporter)